MNKNCSCRTQLARSASILGLRHTYEEEKPDWVKVQSIMANRILNTFSDNNFVLVRPVGVCEMLKTSPFLALRRIPKKNRLILNARRKHWILSELRVLGALPDILDHVNDYDENSPEMTMLSHAIFYGGSQFEAGRRLLQQLIQFIDLRQGANQLIQSVYDPDFLEENSIPMLEFARVLNTQANQASEAGERAKLVANYLISLAKANPSFHSAVEKIIQQNCWNIF